ncbi:unnamed protein product, partial [Medioppia subpectinata]
MKNEELFALAKSKKLFAMEALWSRFLPSYEFAFQELAKGTIGDVLHVTANLGFPNADVIRVATKELGGGTVLDVGVYAINIVEQVFGGEVPEKVEAVGHLNKNGVDFDFAAALQYKNQKTASISCHSMLTLENEATIVGTKGIIKGTIGDVLHVTANLGFPNADVIRVATKELGGGTVLDVGVYAINIVEQVFGGEVPEKVEAIGHLNKNGVDFDFAAALQYKNQKTASISCHSMLTLENEATIVGTKGIIKLGANFHACQKVYVNDAVHEFAFPDPIVPTVYGSTGLCYEANEVRKCLKAGQLESSVMSREASLTISRIQDAIRKQIGVVYDVDPPLQ